MPFLYAKYKHIYIYIYTHTVLIEILFFGSNYDQSIILFKFQMT